MNGSVLDMVGYVRCLFLNVVCCERVCYECALFLNAVRY